MSSSLPVRSSAHNAATPPAAPAALRIVPKSHATSPTWSWPKLVRAMEAIERRYADGRRSRLRGKRGAGMCTRELARAALLQVGEVVALIGCHLPIHTPKQRAYSRDVLDPILDAIAKATGHCPKCGVRVASWATPAGPLAFEPCPEHRAAKAEGGAL